MEEIFDIFISYRNDGEGDNFAARLKEDLSKAGYTVYYNEHEKSSGKFPDRLKTAIEGCNDFILILSCNCLERLMRNEKIDWVREEIKSAKKFNKNIVPVLIGKAKMPGDKKDLPKGIRFIADMEAVMLPIEYMNAPFSNLISMVQSKPSLGRYKDAANINEKYDTNKDLNETLEKAQQNDTEAMYELACMYLYGYASKDNNHFKIDYVEASKWLKKLSDKFDGETELPDYVVSGKAMLSNMYYKGLVAAEEQSYQKTLDLLKDAKNRGSKSGFNFSVEFEKIGFMMTDGLGGEACDFNEIVKYLKEKEDESSNNGKNNFAKFYMRCGMFEDAVRVLTKIKDSYPDADYKLGTIYLHGLHKSPPAPDVDKAVNYFTSAANSGHLDSLHALGLVYFRAQYNYKQNYEYARTCFKQAAERGHRGAQYDYAYMCKYGMGGRIDLEEALYYFEEAAKKGHALCRKELALLYQEEACRNYQKAYEWAQQAALLGDSTGEFILGNLLFFGRGCEPNHIEALKYYKRSLNHSFYPAKFMVEKINKIYELE